MGDVRADDPQLELGRGDGPTVRRRLARHMSGHGVELGPGHHPFYLPFAGTVRAFVDRWEPEENRALFPELGDEALFPRPDVVANFDTDRLSPLDDESQDFVIASHVLEHLAEPLGFLGEMYRVLVPGGLALILLPDRRYTFDRDREPTPLAHLIAEYESGVTEVSDAHVREFLLKTSLHEIPQDEAEWDEAVELQRRRSIHVHCWTEDEFPEVIDYCIRVLGQRWELVDAVDVIDGSVDGIEFGYVLRRTIARATLDALADRFHQVLADIRMHAGRQRAATSAAPGPPGPMPDVIEPVGKAQPIAVGALHLPSPARAREHVHSVLRRLRLT